MLTQQSDLQILQVNLHKSRERTHAILNDPDMKNYATLFLQEQYWSPVTKSSPIHSSWILLESKPSIDGMQPRAATYLNKAYFSDAHTIQIDLQTHDVVATIINNEYLEKPLLLVNIYNPPNNNIFARVHDELLLSIGQLRVQYNSDISIIMAGDFNSHHPTWNPQHYTRHDSSGDDIIDLAFDLQLSLLLLPGTVTFPNAGTTIDLIWATTDLKNKTLKCGIATKHDIGSDHYPIATVIAVKLQILSSTYSYNYARTDWDRFDKLLKAQLPSLQTPLTSNKAIDSYTKCLVSAIQSATERSTPRKRPCSHSKRWWLPELTTLRREVNKLRNIYRRSMHPEARRAWKEKDREYIKELAQAKQRKWREFVEGVDKESIWTIKKYLLNEFTPSYIPTIDNSATTNQEKSNIFKQTFFPPPPPADLSDISDADSPYPPEVPFNSTFSLHQIRNTVNLVSGKKAPGPDEISNQILKHALPDIEHHLLKLLQASFNLSHFPSSFKLTTTATVRKSGKPDYTVAKAYRPIALENTIGKIFESVITDLLSYLTETHHLLPPHHYGGRPGRSTEDALLLLTERIHQAWKNKNIFSTIFMDVSGAFNNVHHKRLIHNLHTRRIPKLLILWIQSFLTNRSTQLSVNNELSQPFLIRAGIPQGSPLSPLLYMYYNADLLDNIEDSEESDRMSLGFIDDITYGVEGESDKGNVRKLKNMLEKAEDWRAKHGAIFERSKYVLVHFTRNYNKFTTASIQINGVTIPASNEARYLGVILDQQLRFHSHLQQAIKRGTSAALALQSIGRCSWGLPYQYVRRLYQSTIVPRIDYGAIIWHQPNDSSQSSTQATKLDKVQRLAMRAILGCFRTTPTIAMEVESCLMPTWLRLQKKVLLSVLRMKALSTHHPMKFWINKALHTRTMATRFISPMENLFKQFPNLTSSIESIEPFIRPPWWSSPIVTNILSQKSLAHAHHDSIIPHQQQLAKDATTHIYTDGSNINGKVGAAAFNATLNETTTTHLGSNQYFNIFAAELEGINLGLQQWNRIKRKFPHCHIFTDSQAACIAVSHPYRQSGQSRIKEILDQLDRILQNHLYRQLQITWIPGHYNIVGNEQADKAAKAVAQNPHVHPQFSNKPATHYPLKSSLKQSICSNISAKWTTHWFETQTATALHLRRIRRDTKVTNGPKLYYGYSRSITAKLAQLRTGHCRLNSYLHRFNIVDSAECECGEGKETPEHFLLVCKRYKEDRKTLRKKVGFEGMNTRCLLGDRKAIKHTMEYIKSTERLD